jgi:hypothetical protein
MLEKISKHAQYLWLMLSVVTLFYACYMMYTHGVKQQIFLLLFPVICFAMYWFRRLMWKRMEAEAQRRSEDQ